MQAALRKIGNSTGLIVPRALLAEIGVASGAAMDLRVEDGKLIATPVTATPRAGWAEGAVALADEDHADWHGFGNEGDADLTW
jgi:antitoxin MazE